MDLRQHNGQSYWHRIIRDQEGEFVEATFIKFLVKDVPNIQVSFQS